MPKTLNLYYAISSKCNLRCSYCYVPEAGKSNPTDVKDTEENLRFFLDKLQSESYKLGAFCFHGAEPTIYNAKTLSQYCNMVLDFKKKSKSRNNLIAIQTNGYNVDRTYLQTLLDNLLPDSSLRLGFSIDLPKQIHDKYRNNSYDRVFDNFCNALESGVDVSVLSVVSAEAMNKKDELVASIRAMLDLKEKYTNFRKFKIKLATGDLGFKEEDMEMIADILIENSWTKLLQIFSYSYCLSKGNDCDWFEFSPDGSCFSCNKTFMNSETFSNWKLQSFDYIKEKRAILYAKEPTHRDCKSCEYEMYCNSGCPIDRYKSGEMAGKAHECTIIKKVYKHLQNHGINIIDYIHQP